MSGQSSLSGDVESTFWVMRGSQLCSWWSRDKKMVWCDEYQEPKSKVRGGQQNRIKLYAQGCTHSHTHTELHHPPAGRKMSFLSVDDSIFSPMVQHFHSRPLTKGLNLKKRIVSGKLTNVLYTQGLMSGMKASFWNVMENVVLHESEHTQTHTHTVNYYYYHCKIYN